MSRTLVELRDARLDDALFLIDLWGGSLRRADSEEQIADVEQIIKGAQDSAERAVLIAEYDGEPAGAAFVRVATLTPLNLEPTVQIFSLTVAQAFRRKGVGHVLLDGAVAFGERAGVSLVATAASSTSRDGNRFLARIGLAQQAVWRVGPVPTVRDRLTSLLPVSQRRPASRTSLVLAARRSMRRPQAEI